MNIFHFIYGLHIGGAETFLKNFMISFKKASSYNVNIIIQDSNITNEFFVSYSSVTKEHIHRVTPFIKNPVKHYVELKQVLISNKVDILHVHMNSFINPIPIILCHKLGISVIVHSHNTRNGSGGFCGSIVHKLNRKLFGSLITERMACGEEAGKWMFAKAPFKVIVNSIPVEKFCFNLKTRNKIRRELNIHDTTNVFGTISRLEPVKNHSQTIHVFKTYHERNPNSVLIIIGDGTQKSSIESKIKKLNLDNAVKVLGEIQDPAPFYSAFDILLMPSLYEGLPIVGIEAQAAGLPIIASTNVPKATDITNSMKFISLSSPIEIWVNMVIDSLCNSSIERRMKAGIEIENSSYSLNNLYVTLDHFYKNIMQ